VLNTHPEESDLDIGEHSLYLQGNCNFGILTLRYRDSLEPRYTYQLS